MGGGGGATQAPRFEQRRILLSILLLAPPCLYDWTRCFTQLSPWRLFRPVVRARTAMRLGPGGGGDPVNNISPEMNQKSQEFAQKLEEVFLAGQKTWAGITKQGEPKKFYFIGTNGCLAFEMAESFMDTLAYIPSPDGTKMIHRKPGFDYPALKYTLCDMDKEVKKKSEISVVDLFMEDEEKYRDLETKVLKDYAAMPFDGQPSLCIVGESAVRREENRDIIKTGIVIWLDASVEFTWRRTQFVPIQTCGVRAQMSDMDRPPIWALAQGWEGDIDDTEAKLGYTEVVEEHNAIYKDLADIRLRTDVSGIAENSYWGAEKLLRAIRQYLNVQDTDDGENELEEESMEQDLTKFLQSARLAKYLKPALKWCEEQGAASLEDVAENIPEFIEALGLKPLEKKRLEKAAAQVVVEEATIS